MFYSNPDCKYFLFYAHSFKILSDIFCRVQLHDIYSGNLLSEINERFIFIFMGT